MFITVKIDQYTKLLYWRDASLNTLGDSDCIGRMHLSIDYTVVLEGCISQYIRLLYYRAVSLDTGVLQSFLCLQEVERRSFLLQLDLRVTARNAETSSSSTTKSTFIGLKILPCSTHQMTHQYTTRILISLCFPVLFVHCRDQLLLCLPCQ